MRLFIAAYLPAEVEQHFAELVGRLRVAQPRAEGDSVRLMPAERWHMTLAFIGEVADEKADDAIEALQALDVEAPEVRIAGGRLLGRTAHLVAKVRGELQPLGDGLRRGLKKRRVPFDHRPLQPHVTIARPGDRMSRDELAGDLAVLEAYESPAWDVTEIRLMRSRLGPRPTYETLYST